MRRVSLRMAMFFLLGKASFAVGGFGETEAPAMKPGPKRLIAIDNLDHAQSRPPAPMSKTFADCVVSAFMERGGKRRGARNALVIHAHHNCPWRPIHCLSFCSVVRKEAHSVRMISMASLRAALAPT